MSTAASIIYRCEGRFHTPKENDTLRSIIDLNSWLPCYLNLLGEGHVTGSYILLSRFMDTFSYQKHNNHLHPSVNTCSTIVVGANFHSPGPDSLHL